MKGAPSRPGPELPARRAGPALLLAASLCACAALSPSPRDAQINAQVQAELGRYTELQAPNIIDVQTLGGVVYLHGLVDTPFEQALAGSVTRRVPGVKHVENAIGLSNAR
jgi:osmotically-inducible protein OsmY